jgi:hypothetical protein
MVGYVTRKQMRKAQKILAWKLRRKRLFGRLDNTRTLFCLAAIICYIPCRLAYPTNSNRCVAHPLVPQDVGGK